MSPAQENSWWCLDPEVRSIYTTFSPKKKLLPKLNIEFIKNTLQLYRDVRTLSQSRVDKIKPFLFTVNGYDNINNEIRRRCAIKDDVAEYNKN